MAKFLDKIIEGGFYILFFLTPLVVLPYTSELFEFNKIVFTYLLTTILVSAWVTKMIIQKKFLFRRTLLDIPLLFFLVSQLLSTFVSIDFRTSILGYYSRFHGGLLSTISYILLYWAFVSNMSPRASLKAIKFLLSSSIIVSVWAILEHFGRSFSCLIFPQFRTFDVSCWVQDVKNRVFASLGQPNWLAAWITSLTPLTWSFALNSKIQKHKDNHSLMWGVLSATFFLVLLYTKSRSGLLGFVAADLTFWATLGWMILKEKNLRRSVIKSFFIYNLSFIILTLATGTPWTPPLVSLLNSQTTSYQPPTTITGPALETGGTDSGKIRKIVWQGAVDVWQGYPILGSGVETFAFSYYRFRPAAHNLTTEWDYLYNKAHNEYLNYAATTGSVGLLAYLFLIGVTIFMFVKFQSSNFNLQATYNLKIDNWKLVNLALASGYISILVTNFFGFSVVPVALLFFLYPAVALCLAPLIQDKLDSKQRATSPTSIGQKALITITLLIACYLLLTIGKYWYADYLYARGKLENEANNPTTASVTLNKALKISPNEAIFWDELSSASTNIAIYYIEKGDEKLASKYASDAILEAEKATSLSAANVNLKKNQANMFIKLSPLNPDYLVKAKDILLQATQLAPTDAKLFYNLSVAQLRTGDYEAAIKTMQETISLKDNYRDARYALALMYIDTGQTLMAKKELEYILTNLDPQDSAARRELDELGI